MAATKRNTEFNDRQKTAITLLVENIHSGCPKSITQVLKDAGYAPNTVNQWQDLMRGIRPHLQETLDWLELHRLQIMSRMDNKILTADYGELRQSLDTITKAHQLLGGKATHRIGLSREDRDKLDQLLDE